MGNQKLEKGAHDWQIEMQEETDLKPPRTDHTGKKVGNRQVIDFAGRDEKNKPRWNYKCLACGEQADKPATWDNLRSQERQGVIHCINCKPDNAKQIPLGTECNTLESIGDSFLDRSRKTKGHPFGIRMVPTRCIKCGKEEPKDQANFLSGKANCQCTKHTMGGLSDTPLGRMFHAARQRSREKGWEFDLTIDDLVEMGIPETCPCLGIPLNTEIQERSPNSPSLDRIDNSKGYTKTNVWIISDRANKIKNDSTPEEMLAIANAVLKRLKQ